jgi:hypothetical protein
VKCRLRWKGDDQLIIILRCAIRLVGGVCITVGIHRIAAVVIRGAVRGTSATIFVVLLTHVFSMVVCLLWPTAHEPECIFIARSHEK